MAFKYQMITENTKEILVWYHNLFWVDFSNYRNHFDKLLFEVFFLIWILKIRKNDNKINQLAAPSLPKSGNTDTGMFGIRLSTRFSGFKLAIGKIKSNILFW